MTVMRKTWLGLPLVVFIIELLLGETISSKIVDQQGIMETALSLLLLNTKVHYFKFKNFKPESI
jgi:hypothetical protein